MLKNDVRIAIKDTTIIKKTNKIMVQIDKIITCILYIYI